MAFGKNPFSPILEMVTTLCRDSFERKFRSSAYLFKTKRQLRIERLEPRALLAFGNDIALSSSQSVNENNLENELQFPGIIPQAAIVGAGGSFDLRSGFNNHLSASQRAAATELQLRMPTIAFNVDSLFGVPATVSNGLNFLTAISDDPPDTIAKAYVRDNQIFFGLGPTDTSEIVVSSQHTSSISNLTHVYLQQTFAGLDVFGGVANISINSNGQIVNVGNRFAPDVADSLRSLKPIISAEQAVVASAENLGLKISEPLKEMHREGNANPSVVLSDGGISRDPIPAKLLIVPMMRGESRIAWNTVINMRSDANWYEINVDATTGEVLGRYNWTAYDSYRVFPKPLENPFDGVGLPSSHAVVNGPANIIASPFGWHDTNGVAGAEFFDTRGNNVFAQEDRDGNNTGGLRAASPTNDYDFAFDPTQSPLANLNQATVNLFYWNNIVHDVMSFNGFDAAAGNFQFNNYGGAGLGGDPVQADAQDAATLGTANNANFSTPPDGFAPRMQMYEFTSTTPRRDSDNDSGIMVHEYTHGISNRLVAGPAIVNALQGIQSGGMGEGWSDWYALVFTANSSDTKTGAYPSGTYVLGQPANGSGIRRFPYSTNQTIDPLTYDDINAATADVPCPSGCGEVHNVGEIWSSVLWDMYWNLVTQYGFDGNLYSGTAGNNLALKLVTEGMKLTPANPTMLQARDAILAADLAMTGGVNNQLLWTAFAGRGMGFSAYDGGNHNSVGVVEAFDLPASRRGRVDFDQNQYQIGNLVSVIVRDLDLTQASINLNVTSSSGDFEVITLSRITGQTGVYQGNILTSAGAPTADNKLQLVIGGRIDITYIDANDGAGGLNVVNTDTAEIGNQANAFEGLLPLGGLQSISRVNSGTIQAANGQYGVLFFVESGQKIGATVTPTNPAATLSVQLMGISGIILATAPGQVVSLPPTAVGISGQQIIIVSSNVPTGFSLDVGRNFIRETVDTADGQELSIDGSLIDFGSRRFGVLGNAKPNGAIPDQDEYTVDLSGQAGKPIDIILAGVASVDFSGELVELLDPNGNVVATALADPVQPGIDVTNYDLGILGYVVPIGGIYTIRFTSTNSVGDYSITITDSTVFDSEPNDSATNPLRSLDNGLSALGNLQGAAVSLVFSSRSLFNAASPGLPVETFQAGNVGPAGVVACNAPMNSASNDACFTPGKILPGIEIQDNPGPSLGGLVILGQGVIGNTSIVAGPAAFAENTDIKFPNNNVYSVGMDVLANQTGIVGITIFGLNGVVISTSSVNASPTGIFWGITSDQLITKISLTSSLGELVDNVAFGGTATSGVDRYSITLNAGEILGLVTKTLFAHPLTVPKNTLDPQLRLIHPDGTTVVASDLNSENGRDARLIYSVSTSGVYIVEISGESGAGDYRLSRFVDNTPPSTLSFKRKTPLASPTNADSLVFLATFSEAVTGVGTGDFAVVGTTGTISVTQVTPSTYDVTVSGGNLPNLNGTVGLNLNSPTIFDLFGNALPNVEPTLDETYVVDNAPPTVTDIIVSGSGWSASFIDTIDGGSVGSGNGLGKSLSSGLILPNDGINRIIIQFSEAVVGFNATRFALLGVNLANYVNLITSVTYDSASLRGTIALSTTIIRDKLRIGVADTVSDLASNLLDGDLNGAAGGNTNLLFGVLVGDANGDGSVNGGDLPDFANSFNIGPGFVGYNARADWNSDGSVNGGDLPIFATNFNQSLPTSDPGALNFGSPVVRLGFKQMSPFVGTVLVYGKLNDDDDDYVLTTLFDDDVILSDEQLLSLDE